MQIVSKYLDCGIEKLIKKILKINKINVLCERIVLKNTSAINALMSLKQKIEMAMFRQSKPCPLNVINLTLCVNL